MDQINHAVIEDDEAVIVHAGDSSCVIEITKGSLAERRRIARQMARLMNAGEAVIHAHARWDRLISRRS